MSSQKFKNNKREIKLRPHHVWGLHDIQENTENYYLPDEEYIARWREQEGEIKYIEKLILHGRDTIRFLFLCIQIVSLHMLMGKQKLILSI